MNKLALVNNFAMAKKFLNAKFDCYIYSIFLFFSRIMYSMRPNVGQSCDKSVAGLNSSTRRALYISTLNLSILFFMPEIQTMTSESSILDWLEPYWDLRESKLECVVLSNT